MKRNAAALVTVLLLSAVIVAQDRVDHDGAAGARGRPAITLIGCVRCFHLP